MNYKGRIVPSVTSHNSKWSTIMSWPWVGTFISLDWISLSYAGVTEPALSPAPSQLSSTHLGGVLGGTQGTDSICSNGQVQLLGGLLKMHWLGCCVPAKGNLGISLCFLVVNRIISSPWGCTNTWAKRLAEETSWLPASITEPAVFATLTVYFGLR